MKLADDTKIMFINLKCVLTSCKLTQKLRGVVSFCESTASSFLNSEDRHPICRAILALGKAIDWHKALKHAKFGDLKESIVYIIYIYNYK